MLQALLPHASDFNQDHGSSASLMTVLHSSNCCSNNSTINPNRYRHSHWCKCPQDSQNYAHKASSKIFPSISFWLITVFFRHFLSKYRHPVYSVLLAWSIGYYRDNLIVNVDNGPFAEVHTRMRRIRIPWRGHHFFCEKSLWEKRRHAVMETCSSRVCVFFKECHFSAKDPI